MNSSSTNMMRKDRYIHVCRYLRVHEMLRYCNLDLPYIVLNF
jgi:hypothetical protein